MSTKGRDIPFHVLIQASASNGLTQNGYVKCEHIVTVDKNRVQTLVGHLDADDMDAVEQAMLRALGIRRT